jgi:hypothetical protein
MSDWLLDHLSFHSSTTIREYAIEHGKYTYLFEWGNHPDSQFDNCTLGDYNFLTFLSNLEPKLILLKGLNEMDGLTVINILELDTCGIGVKTNHGVVHWARNSRCNPPKLILLVDGNTRLFHIESLPTDPIRKNSILNQLTQGLEDITSWEKKILGNKFYEVGVE